MHSQRGVSLSGFMLWSVVLIIVLLLAFKIGPPYFEFMTINKQLKATANDPAVRGGTKKDMLNAFMNRQIASDFKSITYQDVVYNKEGDDVVLTADYTVCVPIVSNLRACMDFAASSR